MAGKLEEVGGLLEEQMVVLEAVEPANTPILGAVRLVVAVVLVGCALGGPGVVDSLGELGSWWATIAGMESVLVVEAYGMVGTGITVLESFAETLDLARLYWIYHGFRFSLDVETGCTGPF